MSELEEEGKKKRGAERQLTKDEYNDANEDEDITYVANGEFKKADAETLAKRRIVKVKRPSASSEKQENPFSAATLTKGEGKSVFGSAFKSSGFGATKDKLSFGSGSGGFGSASSTNGTGLFGRDSKFTFGTNKSTTSVFGGASASETSKFSFGKLNASDSTKKEAVSLLPENVQVSNGEEGEECLMEVRARSFEWVKQEEREGPKSGEEEAASMAVFTADKNGLSDEFKKEDGGERLLKRKEKKGDTESEEAKKKAEAGKKEEEAITNVLDDQDKSQENAKKEEKTEIYSRDMIKGGQETSETNGDTSESTESRKESQEKDLSEKEVQNQPISNDTDVDAQKETPRRWREMGIGPLRVLRASSTGITRVVQRRENAEGGMGTKVLINASLQKESHVTKQSEKHLQLATVGSGVPALHLLKVKPQDLPRLYDLLKTQIEAAKSALAE
mmetsp:Transcript_28978/g.43780  ORF Transcript_28978/g.43780 Transcript_28978/m.43780 type:complete len:447 (-) Transcript_28978:56-1396(-)|eukprot:CAMPEP_0178914432 /NCGR_PEP_ID=MMETSP0786-20121207/11423_1 /TAXON_ID=186022 /ORGANISM="Thalassionema frauenfeldii, Strain CCMP 1798" /LENGTH=446 /DNA_ID=CAMNT_0020587341 /DNA_START=253 /DNA_END=1593 /DNA_ORIENTATION=+